MTSSAMRTALSIVLAASLLFSAADLRAGAAPSDPDSLVQELQTTAWEKAEALEEAGEWDELTEVYRAYSQELFELYRAYPEEEAGYEALEHAARMWGQAGATDLFEEALPHIDRGAEAWPRMVGSIILTYQFDGRRADAMPVLETLSDELTDPKAQSEMLLALGDYHTREENTERARSFFEDVLAVDADMRYSARAHAALYELDPLQVGDVAPEFTAQTTDGETLRLADLEGEVVLLEFWATWCAPCLPKIPLLKELHASYENEDFRLIGVSLDQEKETLAEFIDEEEMAWTQIWEDRELGTGLTHKYQIRGIPDSYLIDRDGRIAGITLRGDALQNAISDLVERQR